VKPIVRRIILICINFLAQYSIGRFIEVILVDSLFKRTTTVSHNGCELTFCTPNYIPQWRSNTFSIKEPETLEWIDRFQRGSVFWDVGANVGIYSCYAAKRSNSKVFAFEPSVFNLELLARNIVLNCLSTDITIVPLPLTDKLRTSVLNMSSLAWGGAMSSFGEQYGHDGEIIENPFIVSMIGISMDDAINLLAIAQPIYIKIDVDGIEDLILKGGAEVLTKVKSILVEVNDNFLVQADNVNRYLIQAGFTLNEKKHADYFDTLSTAASTTYNQIWSKVANKNFDTILK
jgi:FkbM family methyltransferase